MSPYDDLDETMHAPRRLAICSYLASVDQVDFSTVRDALGITDQLLSKQIRILVDAGYAASEKVTGTGSSRRPRTWLKLTPQGRKAFEHYVAGLRRFLGQTPMGPVGKSAPPTHPQPNFTYAETQGTNPAAVAAARMNGLPENVNFEFFVGRELGGITFGRWQTIFLFDQQVELSVESEFELHEGKSRKRFSDPLLAAQRLVQYIGSTVTGVGTQTDGTLILTWESGQTMTVFDSTEHYESYQVHHGEAIWVV